ncbi:uncharacterized protein LOC111384347 [Olea europaea var. sylvestris]|uniref:uncharacterized protein LOC111384347 n=1 Tax=Olea europaea var. sylvestris TaxID=158386 RepID=UPI000C1CEBA0|nr:uncharacterized protein LOC111384347 [Olea europaea var. sylvestris]
MDQCSTDCSQERGYHSGENEKNELIRTRTLTGWRVCIDYCKLNAATRNDHFPLLFIDQMLERLVGDPHYCFLDGYSEYNLIPEGIVLGHKISAKGIEVDIAKIQVIEKLPPPTSVKGVRSILGHAGFYRRFIKNFSKITKPLRCLLMKESTFEFTDECLLAFNTLKEKLISAPVIITPDWNLPFELMCNASDFAVGALLG